MSHHHMTLPPIVYTAQPRPQKVENRKRVRLGPSGEVDESEESEDTEGTSGFGQAAKTSGQTKPQNFEPIEDSSRKPRSTTGRLSEGTLKTMLLTQEMGS
jgi:hypothetical protein